MENQVVDFTKTPTPAQLGTIQKEFGFFNPQGPVSFNPQGPAEVFHFEVVLYKQIKIFYNILNYKN